MEKYYLILGLRRSGLSAIKFLLKKNKKVIAADRNIESIEIQDLKNQGIEIYRDDHEFDFSKIKTLVLSPGIPKTHKLVQEAKKNNVEIISEIEIGARYLKNRCIGITGTNGKTTLTLLITHVLNKCNIKAIAVGNVGNALTSYLLNPNNYDVLIIELSSYQLESINESFLEKALILNISEDHLDRYESYEKYAKAKFNILKTLKQDGTFYISDNLQSKYFSFINKKNVVKKIKEDVYHGAMSICLDLGISEEDFFEAIKDFKRPEHRLEYICDIDEISFYNDSKATNVDAVIYAVKKIKKPIVLIVGGEDKGFDFFSWEKAFQGKIKYIFAIGKASEKIKKQLNSFDVEIVTSLEVAVEKAFKVAMKKDNILLSPGCSSFDMFENFEHRGNEFKRIVYAIKGGVFK